MAIARGKTNDMTAHNEWANRPDDECYPDLKSLYAAVKARRDISAETVVPFQKMQFGANGTVFLKGKSADGQPLNMVPTNWAFEQFHGLIDGPKPGLDWLRGMQDRKLVADILTYQAQHAEREGMQMLYSARKGESYGQVRAFTTEVYSRLWDEVAVRRTMDLVSANPDWHNPTKTRRPGHVGLYASDRNLFIFLINESKIEAGRAVLNRGVFLWNSETKADTKASYGIKFFYYDEVCGNHIVWGSQVLFEIHQPHIGSDIDATTLAKFNRAMKAIAGANTDKDKAVLRAAQKYTVAPDVVETVNWLVGKKFTQTQAKLMVARAEVDDTDPTNLWSLVCAGTRLNQDRAPGVADNRPQFTETRTQMDERVGSLLQLAVA